MHKPDDPRLWLARINAFRKTHWEELKEERGAYRDALQLKMGGRWSGANGIHVVNYSYRYITWFQAQVTGEDPVIRSPRDADGDEILGEMVDLLLLRVLKEGDLFRSLRDVVVDLGWFGSGAIWYGFHSTAVSKEQARDAGRSVMEIADRAIQGDMAARPDEDHDAAAQFIDAKLAQTQDPYEAAALGVAATDHDRARAEDDDALKDVHLTDHRVWFRRGRIGIDTFWSNEVLDLSDVWWMAHKTTWRPEQVHEMASLKPGLRRKLKGTKILDDDGKPRTNLGALADVPEAADDSHRVELYHIFDKRTRRRHIISPEMPEKFLEDDSSNPYVDEMGRPSIPGFFPCQVFQAIRPPVDDPIRTTGLPMVAPGWAQQMEANELRTLSLASARRHSARHYVLDPSVTGEAADAIRAPLARGEDACVFQFPPGTGPDKSAKDLIYPISFGHDNGEVILQTRMVEQDWVKVMGMPQAELSSMATASTATQEQIGISAGHNQAEDIIKQIEEQMARLVEGVRGLVRSFYPIERIAGIVGRRYTEPRQGPNGEQLPSLLDLWNASSLEGDAVKVRFGVRAKAENAVRTNQIMQALQAVKTVVEPTTGLPRVEEMPLVEELTRALGIGKPQEIDPNLNHLRHLVVQQMQQIEMLKGMLQQASKAQPSSGGERKKSEKTKPGKSKKAPTAGNLEAGARRGTASASA